MGYNSYEIEALVAPLFGLSMEDLADVVVIGFTRDHRVVFCDSRVGNQGPSGPEAETPESSPEQRVHTVLHALQAAASILNDVPHHA